MVLLSVNSLAQAPTNSGVVLNASLPIGSNTSTAYINATYSLGPIISAKGYSSEPPKTSSAIRLTIIGSPATRLDDLDAKIRQCESNNKQFNDDGSVRCNRKYGCGGGIGVYQLIQSTADHCSKKMNMTINPYKEADNRMCGRWLLENEGPFHWGTPTSWWGSFSCWSSAYYAYKEGGDFK